MLPLSKVSWKSFLNEQVIKRLKCKQASKTQAALSQNEPETGKPSGPSLRCSRHSCSLSVVAAGQCPMGRLCCGPGSTMDVWLCLCHTQQSHPRAELAFPLFLCMSLFLVPGSSGTCCEHPAPTQAAPSLSWLPGLAQTGSESETESSVVCTSVLSFTTSDFSALCGGTVR